ncbi:lasso RiPP family leader peptide-containing protein [Streptomyces sp. LARHCF252]
MNEGLMTVETVDFYEPPLLAEAGAYADLTQGEGGGEPEGAGPSGRPPRRDPPGDP